MKLTPIVIFGMNNAIAIGASVLTRLKDGSKVSL
mgnify:CR=1 FL=1